ncbi:MAG: endonuclease [Saprospiraceae bacterium]|nr:endonuclease [Saprospiraceae bacterium]
MFLFRIQNPGTIRYQYPLLDSQVWHPNRTLISQVFWSCSYAGTLRPPSFGTSQSYHQRIKKNAPFKDIPDDQTKYWIYKDKVLTTIPRINIHQYSESKSNTFEPVEFRKGDIARSIFYFYTLYKSAADKKSKTFFTSMLPDLCRWHRMDKVDSANGKDLGHCPDPIQYQPFYLLTLYSQSDVFVLHIQTNL